MPIKQDQETGKWQIGESIARYHTQDSAQRAYDNYLKRGGKPVAPHAKTEG